MLSILEPFRVSDVMLARTADLTMSTLLWAPEVVQTMQMLQAVLARNRTNAKKCLYSTLCVSMSSLQLLAAADWTLRLGICGVHQKTESCLRPRRDLHLTLQDNTPASRLKTVTHLHYCWNVSDNCYTFGIEPTSKTGKNLLWSS